ncbi:DUF2809 domain-containing protein [Dactylosporangium sp. NPDC048998]|uniref:ribosomal maturation YjgA family protein n=1 Tax=Dactylosporangium sp. NPDC048998 TaxID=3363976 RepID=UPI00371CA70E
MLESTRAVRVAAVVTAVAAIVVALGIRAVAGGHLNSNGALQQYSGTALYASAVYAGVVFLRPRISPVAAGAWAIGLCWAMEAFQLTDVPRTLSQYSIVLRLIFGVAFDWVDVWWYPAGVIPLVLVEVLAKTRGSRR